MQFTSKKCMLTCLGLGLISLGLILAAFWMSIFHGILAKELALAPKARSFELWKNPPVKLNFDIYLFNWTNPCNLTSEDYEKPILQQIGPYRFREIPTKSKVKWHPENKTISYRRKSTYFFVEEESKGRLDDTIVTINAIAVAAAHTSRFWGFTMQKQVSMGLSLYGHQPYIVKKANELLFDGYEDDLISMAATMQELGMDLNIPYRRFGWMYDRNESERLAGHFNMHTGADDISQMGQMRNWNYAPETPYYDSPCNEVRGSGGEFYPPGQTKDRPLTFFNGELCRYLDLYFDEEQEIGGLNVYKYASSERSVDNGTAYNEYSCFLSGEELPSGVMNVSMCRYGAPVFVSFPHFYAADPYYLQFVDGLQPEKEKHEFQITMEPTMAIPVDVAARLQVNVKVQTYPDIGIFQETPTIFFPVLWFEQKVRIPEEMLNELLMAGSLPTIGYICCSVIVFIGAIIVTYAQCFDRIRQPQALKKPNNPHRDELTASKNGTLNEKFNRNLIEQQSPLVKSDDKPLGNVEFKRMHGTFVNVPLATPEPDLECNDHVYTQNHKF